MKFPIFTLLALIVAVLACGAPITDLSFHIAAAYRANTSGYQVDIETQGVVRAGHDISDNGAGRVQITPISSTTIWPVTIDLETTSKATISISGEIQEDEQFYSDTQEKLLRVLEQAGYESLSREEVEETVRAIFGAISGPKGVMMDGQTEWLQVISVQIDE